MKDFKPDWVLYDCMGYAHGLQDKAQFIHGVQGIVSVGAIAEYGGKLLGV